MNPEPFDTVSLQVFRNLFSSLADEMGIALQRASFSPNIKMRRDFSCAVFDDRGLLLAQAAHIPVHLGAMALAMESVIEKVDLQPGDVAILNNPFAGGTHLPDISLVSAAFADSGGDGRNALDTADAVAHRLKTKRAGRSGADGLGTLTTGETDSGRSLGPRGDESASSERDAMDRRLSPKQAGERLGYVMSRAHHSDVGGITPASMPLASEIFAEGLIIPPIKLVEAGRLNEDVMKLVTANVRTPDERRGDLLAQLAAQTTGERRFAEIAVRYGVAEIRTQAAELMRYSELMTRWMIDQLDDGEFGAEDWMDDDGFRADPIPIRVTVQTRRDGGLTVDFSETAGQRSGPINAVRAVTHSALLYVIRTLIGQDVPVNAGMLKPVRIVTRPGTLVDALTPAAVSAGNVETSQRIVDALFRAFAGTARDRTPAASQGTMNNLALGGYDAVRGRPFAYYETLGGGMGARPGVDGMSAVHDHMSNTLNTPVEALEGRYPIRILRYEIRHGSGGNGMWRGGDGLRRDIEFLSPATVSIVSERRKIAPYGLFGGEDGTRGENVLIRGGETTRLPGKVVLLAEAGDVLSIRTPGGGGYGGSSK